MLNWSNFTWFFFVLFLFCFQGDVIKVQVLTRLTHSQHLTYSQINHCGCIIKSQEKKQLTKARQGIFLMTNPNYSCRTFNKLECSRLLADLYSIFLSHYIAPNLHLAICSLFFLQVLIPYNQVTFVWQIRLLTYIWEN